LSAEAQLPLLRFMRPHSIFIARKLRSTCATSAYKVGSQLTNGAVCAAFLPLTIPASQPPDPCALCRNRALAHFASASSLLYHFCIWPFLHFCLATGCGQLASAEHIARRLQRLEWATRFRPIHIQALLLTASAPEADSDFLYSPDNAFTGPAGMLLSALGINTAGKSSEEVLADFQKRGLVLASLLECPVERGTDANEAGALRGTHLPQALARIRRSLKPKRVLVVLRRTPTFGPRNLPNPLWAALFFYTFFATFRGEFASDASELAAFRAALPALAAQGT